MKRANCGVRDAAGRYGRVQARAPDTRGRDGTGTAAAARGRGACRPSGGSSRGRSAESARARDRRRCETADPRSSARAEVAVGFRAQVRAMCSRAPHGVTTTSAQTRSNARRNAAASPAPTARRRSWSSARPSAGRRQPEGSRRSAASNSTLSERSRMGDGSGRGDVDRGVAVMDRGGSRHNSGSRWNAPMLPALPQVEQATNVSAACAIERAHIGGSTLEHQASALCRAARARKA